MILSEMKDGILYSMPQAGKKNTSLHTNISIPVKLGKCLNLRISGNYHYDKLSFQEDKKEYQNWMVGYLATIQLPHNILIIHDLFYTSSTKSLYTESKERPSCSVTIIKTFPKQGLQVELSMLDIFNKTGL